MGTESSKANLSTKEKQTTVQQTTIEEKHVVIKDNKINQVKNHDEHKEVKPIEHNGVFSEAGKVGKSHGNYFKVMDEHQSASTYRPISKEELAEHASLESAWLSYKGIIYDATTYMKYHPGGKKLLDGCGKECDELFYKYHPWVNAEYLLQKYKIGYLSKSNTKTSNSLKV